MAASGSRLTFDAEHPDRPHRAGRRRAPAGRCWRARGIRATFFLQGRWVEAFPDIARRDRRGGAPRSANHSHYHVRMPLLTGRRVRDATSGTPRPAIRDARGRGPAAVVPAARSGPARTTPRCTRGWRPWATAHVGWDVDRRTGSRGVTETAMAAVAGGGLVAAPTDGAIVLLHAWPTPTAGARRLGPAAACGTRVRRSSRSTS